MSLQSRTPVSTVRPVETVGKIPPEITATGEVRSPPSRVDRRLGIYSQGAEWTGGQDWTRRGWGFLL